MSNLIVSIIGASGAIGKRLHPFLVKHHPDIEFEGTYFNTICNGCLKLDIKNYKTVKNYLEDRKPFAVIWLAGTKDVKRCENEQQFAIQLNCLPVENLIKSLKAVSPKTRILFISSDYVFDGSKGFYTEIDQCNPLTNYGRSKLFSENMLISSGLDYLIIRTSAIMIRNSGFLGWLVEQLRRKTPVSLFLNTYFSPTPIELLNKVFSMCLLNPKWNKKILHVAGPRISRYQFGLKLAKTMSVELSLIKGIDADFKNSTFQPDISLQTSQLLQHVFEDAWDELIKEALDDKIY